MVNGKFGRQTECIMGNWKIENSALLLSSERTSKPFSLLGRLFLCSQCVESALDKLILYTSYVTLFITIKPAMGVSHSLFHPYGICVFTTQ